MSRRAVRLRFYVLLGLLLPACAGAPAAPEPAPAAATRWEADIQQFERADRKAPPAPGGVLFVGSSSIRMWESLAEDFPGVPVLNRGFGGSELADVLLYVERIVIPYRPRRVVVYAGENDLAAGKEPERVVAEFRALVARIHAELPDTRIGFVSIKPSPSRWHLAPAMRRANAAVRDLTAGDPRLFYVDVFSAMLDADGRPREEIFLDDRLHMNARGYEIWRVAIRPHL
jgi:lysophospholipase L1-like esterase